MRKKEISCFFVIAFFCWFIPFGYRVFFMGVPSIEGHLSATHSSGVQNTVETILRALAEDKEKAFILIFINNLKGCLLNMAGGVFLGLGTVVNLIINGFYSADVFVNSYQSGLTVSKILSATLPHSFELIGFWLSGAVGFYIAWNFFLFFRSKECFTVLFCKKAGAATGIVFIIILLAAYVEAYISVN